MDEPLITKTGKALTDEDIQALADEAEAGYDVTHLMRQRVNEELAKVLEPEAIEQWWTTPDPAFLGFSPEQMLQAGQGSTVLHKAVHEEDASCVCGHAAIKHFPGGSCDADVSDEGGIKVCPCENYSDPSYG